MSSLSIVLSLTAILCIYIHNIYVSADTFTFEINNIFLEDKPDCDAGYGHP